MSESMLCPFCGRMMSFREHDEQASCNACYTGAPISRAEYVARLDDVQREALPAAMRGRLP